MTYKSVFISLLIGVFSYIAIGVSRADDITITTCDFASLQSAIRDANGLDEAVIQFDCEGTISFTTQISITGDIHLIGNDAITLDGTGRTRLFYVAYGASFTLENVTIQNGYATEFGGALLNDGGSLTVHKTLFNGNQAGFGGAIYNFGAMTITDSYFMRNNGGFGGALYNDKSDATIINTYFYHNTSFYGAVVYNGDGLVNFLSAKLWENNTGAGFWDKITLFNTENAVTDMQMSDIYGKSEYYNFFNEQGTFLSSQTHYEFISCSGIGIIDNGGNTSHNSFNCPDTPGLLAHQYLEVTDCDHFWGTGTLMEAVIIANRAGGTITFTCSGTFYFPHEVMLTGHVIINSVGNVIFDGGGKIGLFYTHPNGATVEFSGLTFQNSYGVRDTRYRAIHSNGYLTITNSTFINNVGEAWGGGAVEHFGSLTISDSVFMNNRSDYGGGAIQVRTNANALLSIINSTFTDNTSESGHGGAIKVYPDYLTEPFEFIIMSSTFTNNHAEEGGAISVIGQLTVHDSIFADNTADIDGDAIRYRSINGLFVSENTIYRNNDCAGVITDLGGNRAENAEGCPQS